MFPARLLTQLHRIPLWLLSLLTLAGYLIFLQWFPLLPNASRVPAADIRTFAAGPAAGLGYALLLGWLFGCYALAARRVRRDQSRQHPLQIAAIALLFGLPLLFAYPINATDVYRYFVRGRISSVYQDSPFAVPPNSFPEDPFLPLAGEWAGATSPYGPIWETAAAALTALAGERLALGLLLFKGLALVLHLALGALLYVWASRNRNGEQAMSPTALLLLWTWNPALLLTFVVNGHNDALMLLWLIWGAWVMQRGHHGTGFLLMLLAPLTKPIGLLPLPFFWLGALRRRQSWPDRFRFVGVTAMGSLVVGWLAFLPVGSPLDLAQRLLQEATAVGGFSITALAVLLARALQIPLSAADVIRAGQILLVLVAAWLAWRGWRGRLSWPQTNRATAAVFQAYLLTAFSFRIWYAVWPYAWLLLSGSRRQRKSGQLLLFTTQLSVLIYGHLRVYALAGDQTLAHLVGVPFTFALPFLLPLAAPDNS